MTYRAESSEGFVVESEIRSGNIRVFDSDGNRLFSCRFDSLSDTAAYLTIASGKFNLGIGRAVERALVSLGFSEIQYERIKGCGRSRTGLKLKSHC